MFHGGPAGKSSPTVSGRTGTQEPLCHFTENELSISEARVPLEAKHRKTNTVEQKPFTYKLLY